MGKYSTIFSADALNLDFLANAGLQNEDMCSKEVHTITIRFTIPSTRLYTVRDSLFHVKHQAAPLWTGSLEHLRTVSGLQTVVADDRFRFRPRISLLPLLCLMGRLRVCTRILPKGLVLCHSSADPQ